MSNIIMNNQKSLIQVPFRYGVYGSIVNALFIFLLYSTGRHPILIPPFLDSRILVFLVFIYFVIRDYKENYNSGFLHTWEGILLGIQTYMWIGLLGSVFVYTLGRIHPAFVSDYITNAILGMETAKEELMNGPQAVKMTVEEYQRHLNALKQTTAANLAVDYFLKSLLIGFFIPLVYAALFRKVERT